MRKILLFLLLLLLVGCDKKTYEITISENISLVDQSLNLGKISPNQEVELQVSIPDGKTLDKLLINGVDKKDLLNENLIIKVTVTEALNISVTFIDTYIVSISFPNDNNTFTFDIDEFRLSNISFKVLDSNNKTIDLTLKREHLSLTDFLKLFKVGDHEIKINYENQELIANVKLTSNNPSEVEDIIVYSILDGKTHKYYIIGNFVSYELNLTQSILSQGTILNMAGGILKHNYNRKNITIIHTFGALKSGHSEVFHIRYDSDIELNINIENCSFYNYNEEELVKIEHIKYYQR